MLSLLFLENRLSALQPTIIRSVVSAQIQLSESRLEALLDFDAHLATILIPKCNSIILALALVSSLMLVAVAVRLF